MHLLPIDWAIVVVFLLVSLGIGVVVTGKAGSNAKQFFLAGRNMPWWLLGVSMVATTFSTDTPNLVTDIVRRQGVAGNWIWWAFLLTGMLTTFIYAKLWSRSGVVTDVGFYELRYSGKLAGFLRGFRALYLGAFFNVMIMASVTLAAIKIGSVLLGVSPQTVVLVAGTITVLYSMLGGLRGVLVTDFLQFGMALSGSVAAAYYALARPEVGGLSGLFNHPEVQSRLSLFPDFSDPSVAASVIVIPLAVQWWSVWYPGAEPGGGGYVAQRILAAKSEQHAQGATLLFNVAHYALRPWPWILVALSSLLVFPDLASLQAAFPAVEAQLVEHDMAYAAMLTFLPAGLMGLVVASLVAAYMSTISTHLNWGASYIVHDYYHRFINRDASERQLVFAGRVSTALLMVAAGLISLVLSNALQAFQILLQIGAGTGLLFLLRWFWWRVSAASELAAMTVSFLIAVYFQFLHPQIFEGALPAWQQLLIGVAVTSAVWLTVAFYGPATDEETMIRFCQKVRPGGPGWRKVRLRAESLGLEIPAGSSGLSIGIACMALGSIGVYSTLMATGYLLYGESVLAAILGALAVCSGYSIYKLWTRLDG